MTYNILRPIATARAVSRQNVLNRYVLLLQHAAVQQTNNIMFWNNVRLVATARCTRGSQAEYRAHNIQPHSSAFICLFFVALPQSAQTAVSNELVRSAVILTEHSS